MLIKQSQLLGEATAFLETLDRLTIDENSYPAKMVNVRHNSRLGKDLIQLESLVRFGQENGIYDGGYAIHLICEANEVPNRNHLAFIVREENMFNDANLLETYCQLTNSNFKVYIAPISDYSPYHTRLVEALNLDEPYDTYDTSPNLQTYIHENILDDAKDTVSSKAKSAKSAIDSGIKDAASKLASVRKEITSTMAKAANATGSAKVNLMRKVNKLRDAASDLRDNITGSAKSISHKATGAANAVKNAIHGAHKSARNRFNDISDHVSNLGGDAKDAISRATQRFDGLSNAAQSAAHKVRSSISQNANDISNAVGDYANKAKNTMSGVSNKIRSQFD